MVVLALETVTRAGSVALLVDGVCHVATGDPARTHGERLPGELLQLLSRHGQRLAAVDLFAVIAGPGSFTGLRIGIAAIQGLAIASGRKIVAVPTLEAMAQAWAWRAPPASAPTIVVACLDAQRGEVFSAAWRVGGAADVAELPPVLTPRVCPPDALAGELRVLAREGRVVAIGSGARRHAAAFDRAIEVADMPVPLAEVAARQAARHPDRAVAPHALRPIYIRHPDAVIARDRAAAALPPLGP